MMRRSLVVVVILVAAAAGAGVPIVSSFLGADAGVPVAFASLDLPPVAVSQPLVASSGGTAIALGRPLPAGPFAPTLASLLEGNTVIRTDAQMRLVWKQLFAAPYDASLFDFETDFVVLMGGGVISNGSFGISAVEQVDATWAHVGGPGGPEESVPFVAVTATTFFNGAFPQDPPPPVQALSAVRIPVALGDDVLFHRELIFGI